jgi:hypothetical protein
MADYRRAVVVWSGGVSAVAATLSGVVASRTTKALGESGWFIALLVIALIAFAILLAAGAPDLIGWLGERRERAGTAESEPPPGPTVVSRIILRGGPRSWHAVQHSRHPDDYVGVYGGQRHLWRRMDDQAWRPVGDQHLPVYDYVGLAADPASPARPPTATAGTSASRRRRYYVALITSVGLAILAVAVVVTVVRNSPGTSAHHQPSPVPSLIATLNDRGQGTSMYSLAFRRGSADLATGDQNGKTYLWNLATHRILTTLTTHTNDAVNAVAFSPDGRMLAAAEDHGKTGTTYLWNLATSKITLTNQFTDDKSGGVDSVAFSPNSTVLATGDDNGGIYLRNLATHTVTTLPKGQSQGVDSLAFSPDRTLAAGDDNGHAYLWNPATHKIINSRAYPARNGDGVEAVAFSPDGKTLAAGDQNGRTYLWNQVTRKTITLTSPTRKTVKAVAFSPNGSILAIGDFNGSAYLWNLGSNKITATR